MNIRFNCTGTERKALVVAIGEVLGAKPLYKGVPTYAYNIDGFVIDKEGTLSFDDRTDSEVVENLLEELTMRGFVFAEPENATQGNASAPDTLVIELPRADFSETAIENIHRILNNKGNLIQKALGIDALPIELTEETIQFPWFAYDSVGDEVKAYTQFVCALCEMAKAKKRINTAVVRDVENEKFAFRCFLLQLGFIGPDFKTTRKILLSKLTGCSAFLNGAPKNQEVEAE